MIDQNFRADARATTNQASTIQPGFVIVAQNSTPYWRMDPEVRQFVISQLVVIALPVGTLFGLWLWMLNWSGRSRRDL